MKNLFVIVLYISALSFSPVFSQNNEQKLIEEGTELHDKGEYREAIRKFESILRINPKSTSATYEMALSYLKLKDYKNALKYSTKVINSNNKNLASGAYCVKSEALAETGKVDDAIKLLQEGILKNGEDYMLHFNMALNYYKKGDSDNTLKHIRRAIDLSKSYSGAYLLKAYALNDKQMWVQSILTFQMFLLLEPDSYRSKNAFEEMLQSMRVKPVTEKPVERSFIQQQLYRNKPANAVLPADIPPLSIVDGLNRNFVYHAISSTMDSLRSANENVDLYTSFKEVNKAVIDVLEKENDGSKPQNTFWNFLVPFFSEIMHSNYYDMYCRYISVSYFPESLEEWNANKEEAKSFLEWFENGENKDAKK